MTHTAAQSKPPDAKPIGELTCKMVNGVLWLFDNRGYFLNMVQSIQVNQSGDTVTTATVVLVVEMEDKPA